MTKTYSFARAEAALAAAASAGLAEAAETFAEGLRASGERAAVETAPDGGARIVLEGAAAVAREFGTQASPARPVVGAALQASRAGIDAAISRKIAEALRGSRS